MDLKEARIRANLTQEELCALVDMTPASISRIENGLAMPHPATRKKIEEVLGPVDWLNEGRPLSTRETQNMFLAINTAAKRMGHEEAVKLFSSKSPGEQRKLTRMIVGDGPGELLLPPGVVINEEDED